MSSRRAALAAMASCAACGRAPSGSTMMDGQTAGSDSAIAATYAAYAILGGLDRVRIVKLTSDSCFEVQLVSPGTNTSSVAVPNGWMFEFGRAVQPSAACNPSYLGPVSNTFDASDAAGSITWQGATLPQSVDDLDVTLAFANHPSWCPASAMLTATNVPVKQ